jgi:hypothetical protein
MALHWAISRSSNIIPGFYSKVSVSSDRLGAFVELLRSCQVALVLQQTGEIVEAFRDFGMLRAKPLFPDRQRTLAEGRRAAVKSPWSCSRVARLSRLSAISG